MPAPLCRFCGKPIRKSTHDVYFGHDQPSLTNYSTNRPERPATKAEAQQLLNATIVSVRLHADGSVRKVSTWDGVSYVDELFCTQEHARLFGYAAARKFPDVAMPAYHDAIKARS